MHTCKTLEAYMRLYRNSGTVKLMDTYLACIGKREGQRIWIISRNRVVQDLYPEWIAGGNDQRYRFNPVDEMWIDDRMGIEELEYTIRHELLERRLMQEQGMSYDRAHNEALKLEKRLRTRDENRALANGVKLASLARDSKAHPKLASVNPEKLRRLYRRPFCRANGLTYWIVDGPLVRLELEPDFLYADSYSMRSYMPKDEIWLDSAMDCFEGYMSVFRRKFRRRLELSGCSADQAYDQSIFADLAERERQEKLSRKHELVLPPVAYGARERGVKKPS